MCETAEARLCKVARSSWVVAFVARSSAEEWDNIIPYERNQRS